MPLASSRARIGTPSGPCDACDGGTAYKCFSSQDEIQSLSGRAAKERRALTCFQKALADAASATFPDLPYVEVCASSAPQTS